MRLCKACVYNDRDWITRRGCLRLSKTHIDPVEGTVKVRGANYCLEERKADGPCGPEGKYYVRIWWMFWRPL